MAENKYLSEQEQTEYLKDILRFVNHVLANLYIIADSYNIDRDNTIKHFATIISSLSDIATFMGYKEQ